jgi:general secretion pathway protein A
VQDLKTPISFITMPFTREFSISQKFNLPIFDEAKKTICDTIDKRMSVSLIAPAGSGKTVVLRSVKEVLTNARYSVGYIKVTDLSTRDMCREIAHTVGAKPSGLFHTLVRNVQECFENSYYNRGIRPVLIIDEAHQMRAKAISMLKLITNFEMDSKLIVSFVLAGQLPLRSFLLSPELEDISQRIYHHVDLRLLSRDESYQYLKHRCDIAAVSPFPFDSGACSTIFEITKGNMRGIDKIALKSLEIAQKQQLSAIDQTIVMQAKNSSWI